MQDLCRLNSPVKSPSSEPTSRRRRRSQTLIVSSAPPETSNLRLALTVELATARIDAMCALNAKTGRSCSCPVPSPFSGRHESPYSSLS